MIEALEQALHARAKALMAPMGIGAEPFPDDPDSYTLTHPKGVVLVVYRRSTYGQSVASDAQAQPRDLEFDLVLLVRNLRRHQGAYTLLDTLRGGFAGWVAPGATRPTRIASDGFRSREDAVWQWALTLVVPSLSMPSEVPADPADPGGQPWGVLQEASFYPEFP